MSSPKLIFGGEIRKTPVLIKAGNVIDVYQVNGGYGHVVGYAADDTWVLKVERSRVVTRLDADGNEVGALEWDHQWYEEPPRTFEPPMRPPLDRDGPMPPVVRLPLWRRVLGRLFPSLRYTPARAFLVERTG